MQVHVSFMHLHEACPVLARGVFVALAQKHCVGSEKVREMQGGRERGEGGGGPEKMVGNERRGQEGWSGRGRIQGEGEIEK